MKQPAKVQSRRLRKRFGIRRSSSRRMRSLVTFSWVVMIGGRSIRLPFLSAIRIHPFRDRVAMNPKRGCGVRDPLLVAREGFLDVELLEFFERFIQHDVPVKHVFTYSFQA